MLSLLLLCTDMRGRESWGGGCGREPMWDLPVEMSGPGLAHWQRGKISWMSPSLAVKHFFITSSPASYPAWLFPLKHFHCPLKKDEQRPCPASFFSCSLFPLCWSLLLYFSLAVPALSPSANLFCEWAVLGGHGGENPAGDDKIHWLGSFYPWRSFLSETRERERERS